MKINYEKGTKSSQYGLNRLGYTHVTIVNTMSCNYVNMSESRKLTQVRIVL